MIYHMIYRMISLIDAPYTGFMECRASYYKVEEGQDGSGFREFSREKNKRLDKDI